MHLQKTSFRCQTTATTKVVALDCYGPSMAVYFVQILMFFLAFINLASCRGRSSSALRRTGLISNSRAEYRGSFSSMMLGDKSKIIVNTGDANAAALEVTIAPPNAMISHLRTRVRWALETWHCDGDINDQMKEDLAGSVVEAIIRNRQSNACEGDLRQQNKMLVNYGQVVAKALRATPGSMSELSRDITLLDRTVQTYQNYLEKNRDVYININEHHERMVKKSYATAVGNTSSLEVYAEAANLMGKKVWVQKGNLWMEDFSINFFRRNGARKDYLKANNHDPNIDGQKEMATALPRDLMLEETFLKDITADTEGCEAAVGIDEKAPARQIRLVDVGSCYNPIGKSANKGAFAVTALDLCPVDPSVLQCDFLDLRIGPIGSSPVIVAADAVAGLEDGAPLSAMRETPDSNLSVENTAGDVNLSGLTDSNNSEGSVAGNGGGSADMGASSLSPKLLQLPAASYDVVAMSLVLNYLPTPALRESMIKKARQLLMPPGEGGQPHRAGILLIIEKESIFACDDIESDVYHNKSTLLNCWKETICSFGFELVRYRNILTPEDRRRCHALAFRTVAIATSDAGSTIRAEPLGEKEKEKERGEAANPASPDVELLARSVENKRLFELGRSGMWIKQDFSSGPKAKKNKFDKNFDNIVSIIGENRVRGSTEGPSVAVHEETEEGGDDMSVNSDTVVHSTIPLRDSSPSTDKKSSIDSPVTAPLTALPVAIVGGGLGGCALALALQRKNIPFVMFEKDPFFTSRKQGYALTLQQGGSSLRMLGLEGEYKQRGVPSLAHESYTSDGTIIGAYGASVRNGVFWGEGEGEGEGVKGEHVHVDPGSESESTGQKDINDCSIGESSTEKEMVLQTESGIEKNSATNGGDEGKEAVGKKSRRRVEKAQSRHNVHIPRQELRDLMMSSISPSHISWGMHFSHYIDKEESVQVCFSDGSTFEASVLVAADGIYSSVRKQLLPFTEEQLASPSKGLNYLGLMVILGISPILLGSRASVIPTPTPTPSQGLSIDDSPSDSLSADIDTMEDLADISTFDASTKPSKRKRSEDLSSPDSANTAMTAKQHPSTSSSLPLPLPRYLPPIESNTAAAMTSSSSSSSAPRSQCQWVDGSTRVFTMPFNRTHTMWQLSFPCTEEEALALTADPSRLKEKALEQCDGWHQPLVTLLTNTTEGMVSGHPAYDRDPLLAAQLSRDTGPATHKGKNTHNSNSSSSSRGGKNKSRITADEISTSSTEESSYSIPPSQQSRFSRVTLLGDAAHPMSPFKAQGANQALLDALCLSTALVSSEIAKAGRRSLAEALNSYEEEMCHRSAVKVLKSRAAAVHLHAPSALAIGNETRASVAQTADENAH